MKALFLIWTLSLLLLNAKEIYIKTMTVKQNASQKSIATLKKAGFPVYTQKYKSYLRIYVGPFKDVSTAKRSLKKIKKQIAKDAFITRLNTQKNIPLQATKAAKATDTTQSIYIKTTTIKKEYKNQTLQSIQNAGYNNLYIVPYKNLLRVYIGPYENILVARRALKGIKKKIAKDAFITKLKTSKPPKVPVVIQEKKKEPQPKKVLPLNKNLKSKKTIQQTSQKKKQTEKKTVKKIQIKPKKEPKKRIKKTLQTDTIQKVKQTQTIDKNKDFFIATTVGMGQLDISNDDAIVLDIELNSDVVSYGLELGYYLTPKSFITLNYQYSDLEDLYLHNIYTSINYQFDTVFYLSPYIGLLGGANMLTWKNYPLNTIASIDPSYSYLVGATIGSDIELSKNFVLYVNYKYWLSDYSFNLISSTTTNEIKIQGEQNFNIGLKLRF